MAGYSVCFIGNSHLAAVAQGWRKDRARARDDVSLVFFGSRAGSVRKMELRDGVIAPTVQDAIEAFQRSSGGKSEIVLADYDAFVLYGMGFKFSSVLPVLADYGTAADLQWGAVKHVISEDLLETILRRVIEHGSALRVLEQIRQASQAPALLCPMPFAPETEFPASALAKHPRLSNPEFLGRIAQRFTGTAAAMCGERGAEFLPQDESTTSLPGFTKAEFSIAGSKWKGERQPASEKHMNDRYGSIMLGRIFSRLDAISGGRVLANGANATIDDEFLVAAQ
jgi:hypothetical protein